MAVAEGTREQPEIASRSAKGERAAGGTGAVSLWLKLLNIGPLLILIVLAAVISLLTPNFLKPGNLSNILAQTAVIAIVAIGQHLVILTRGIDLSVGANLALATVIGGLVFRLVDSAPLVMLAMILTGAAVGAVNGWSTSSGACRIPSSSRLPPSASAAASRSSWRSATPPCAACRTRSRRSAAASTFGIPNSFFVVFAVAAIGAADGQGDGLGPLDLCRRRRARRRRCRWASRSRAC